jgi:hypothetical protein
MDQQGRPVPAGAVRSCRRPTRECLSRGGHPGFRFVPPALLEARGADLALDNDPRAKAGVRQ